LHTNDAPSAFTRIIDMGVEPYLVASTIEGILAQRLIRALCLNCKEAYTPKADELPPDFPQPLPERLYREKGCRECRDTGYAGRTGIFELLKTGDAIRKLCVERVDSGRIREYGIKHGMITLRQSGFEKAFEGITSVDEILRVTKGDVS
jgi:general secretion pathway protein E/type IV pilus assembly protein PilB